MMGGPNNTRAPAGDALPDAPRGNWVDRAAPEAWKPYLKLARFDRPIGAWLLLFPCWWSMLLAQDAAGEAAPNLWYMLLFAIGYFGWDTYTAISFVVWGMFVRLVYVLHVTWFVNSATHMWGYRNYETSDNSRNLWWVAVLAFGEGWHNNHHANQRMARQGHKWWEVDVTYWAILALEKVGLAWNVVKEIPKR